MADSGDSGRRGVTTALAETANERFKTKCSVCLWGSLILATVIHFGVIRFFPALTAANVAFGVTAFEAIELPPEVEIPPPPEQIARPAVPVVAHAALEEDITIAPTTFAENPVEDLPPPPNHAELLSQRPVFTPFTVAPRVKDPLQAQRIVESKYPLLMQEARIEGTVKVWAFIDATGVVVNCLVRESSGFNGLDTAALAAVREFEFVPALDSDRKVPVWISIPITFSVLTPR
jgi:protein TonB